MARTVVWDKIYRKYQQGGPAWASLSDGIHNSFISLLNRAKFKTKSALDLGCGNGKYLKFLQEFGFSVSGIDSSPTAIRMARRALGKKAKLRMSNIYVARLPVRKYDLVISVAAIQHGTKKAIERLVDRIYKSLVFQGKIFITFPRTTSLKRWATFGKAKETAPGTYTPLLGPEKGLPHSFYGKKELKQLFSRFKEVRIMGDNRGRWVVTGQK